MKSRFLVGLVVILLIPFCLGCQLGKKKAKGIELLKVQDIGIRVGDVAGTPLSGLVTARHLCNGIDIKKAVYSNAVYGTIKAFPEPVGDFRYYPPSAPCQDSIMVHLFAEDGCEKIGKIQVNVVAADSSPLMLNKTESENKNVGGEKPSKIEEQPPSPPTTKKDTPEIIIETKPSGIPPGDDNWTTVAGRVEGIENPENYRIIIYALGDKWYLQPYINNYDILLNPDGHFSTDTHGGWKFCLLLADRDFVPQEYIYNALPKVGGKIHLKKVFKP